VKFRPFAEARDYVHKLGLKSQTQWTKYCDSGQKPPDIPSAPNAVYEKVASTSMREVLLDSYAQQESQFSMS
jgi:hypothetical protein